jgi:gliding motility-associated-like protein
MKTRFINITVLFFLSLSANSQVNCTVPLPPVFTSVSVRPETGNIEFTWNTSQSADIAAYLIYEYVNENGVPRGNIIDTIWDPAATSYSYTNTSYKYHSTSYVIASYRNATIPGMDGCPSPFSNVLNTIFTNAIIDSCTNKLTVSWNNYPSSPKKVTGYSVLLSLNGNAFSEKALTDPETKNLIFTDFETNSEHCYVVRANLEDGTFSTSNKGCVFTKMLKPPQWINADYATVVADNSISLSFSIDPHSEISDFQLEKKTGTSSAYEVIADIVSTEKLILYDDNHADVTLLNTYRLSAINSCNIPVIASNDCSNIVLSIERSGNAISLSWNSYKEWRGAVSSYILFMGTGSGFEERAFLLPSDTTFTLKYDDIMYQVTGSELCFFVSAAETANPYGITGQSNSSVVCSVPIEVITVPNVFTPNGDLINDFFRPVLSFTPQKYHLTISDRRGKILFETNDYLEEWDGSQRGKSNTNGVFLWFLETTTPSGNSITKTGTVTIVKGNK